MSNMHQETVLSVRHWNDNLFSFRTTRDRGLRFKNGHFLMIGNSVRSDVLPVLAVGGQAALVPYHLTWELERAEPPQSHDGYWELDDISQVPALVAGLDAAPHGNGRTR